MGDSFRSWSCQVVGIWHDHDEVLALNAWLSKLTKCYAHSRARTSTGILSTLPHSTANPLRLSHTHTGSDVTARTYAVTWHRHVGGLLTNRDELLLRIVLALPYASRTGLVCTIWSSRVPFSFWACKTKHRANPSRAEPNEAELSRLDPI